MEKEKRFIVPPDLQEKLLIFRMTVPEFCIVAALFFAASKQLASGHPKFFILPCIASVLFIRAFDSGANVLEILIKRFRYYILPQSYSIRGDANGNQ